jgi:hypothetical protein
MCLDTVYKTTRGNFDPEYVIKLIKEDKIVEIGEALRILENACSELSGLRKEVLDHVNKVYGLSLSSESLLVSCLRK